MSRLSKVTLGDLVEFQRGFDLPKSQFKKGTVPVISSNGVLGYHNESKVNGPGITIGRSGTVGLPHYINEDFFPHNTALFIKNFKNNHPKYIYYLLKTLGLNEYKSGSGVPTMNRNHLHPLGVSAFLDLPTQTQIAKVLSDLDAKIELNNKINAELEAMAKLIYDYWFVQFEFPISKEQAKAMGKPDLEGKPYKSSGGKMVWNEELMRDVPEGWEVNTLGEISEIKAGGDKPKIISQNRTDSCKVPIFSNGISNEGIYGFTDEAKIFNPSITVSARGTIGYSALRLKPFVPIIRLISITPKNSCHLLFLHHEVKRIEFENSGSVQQQLTVPQVSKLKILIPSESFIRQFEDLISSSFFKIENNKIENQKLAELRDWLLPMLMNGQVKVGEREKTLGMAAEPEVKYGKEISLNQKRKAIAACIILNSEYEEYFGKVKFEKLLHLSEYHVVKDNLKQNYQKHAAGPLDSKFTYPFIEEAKKQDLISIQKAGKLERIRIKDKKKLQKVIIDSELNKETQDNIARLVQLFVGSNYVKPEIVSTLYAVWNNRIIKNELINDELLKQDFMAWSDGKKKYEKKLDMMLGWMRSNGVVPDGWGEVV